MFNFVCSKSKSECKINYNNSNINLEDNYKIFNLKYFLTSKNPFFQIRLLPCSFFNLVTFLNNPNLLL